MRLILTYKLHGAYLGRSAQRTGRESVNECTYRVSAFIECARYAAYQVYYMAVVLHILVKVYVHVMAVAAQIVAGQVHQHHVLGILLGIILKVEGVLAVLLGITGTLGGACYWIDVCLSALNAAMSLGA